MCEWYLLRDDYWGVLLECELRFPECFRLEGFLCLIETRTSWTKWWGHVLGAVVGCFHSWGLRGQVLVCFSAVQHRYRNNVPRNIFRLTSVRAFVLWLLVPAVSFAIPVIIIFRVFFCCVCSEMPMVQLGWIFYRLFLLKLDIWNMSALSVPINYLTTISKAGTSLVILKLK